MHPCCVGDYQSDTVVLPSACVLSDDAQRDRLCAVRVVIGFGCWLYAVRVSLSVSQALLVENVFSLAI